MEQKAEKQPQKTEGIRFENVHYGKILKGVSLSVGPGEKVALVGSSKCCEAIVNLLLRFYEPDKGTVSLDGNDLRRLDVHWLREQIGVVSLDSDDILESKSEKLQFAIAQTLSKEPRILVLDKAFSALINESDELVQEQEALNQAQEGRTTIIVAHNLRAIQDANQIFVFSRGKVKTGKYWPLYLERGTFFDLVNQQQNKQENGEEWAEFDEFDEGKADNGDEEEEQQKSVEMTKSADSMEDVAVEMKPPAVEEAEPDKPLGVPPTTTSTTPHHSAVVHSQHMEHPQPPGPGIAPTMMTPTTPHISGPSTAAGNAGNAENSSLLVNLFSNNPHTTMLSMDDIVFALSIAVQIGQLPVNVKSVAKQSIQQVISDCYSNRLATQLQLPKPQAPAQTTSIGTNNDGGNGGAGTTAAEKTTMDETDMVDVVTGEDKDSQESAANEAMNSVENFFH